MNEPESESRPSGLPAALGAYVIWGFLPLYLLLVKVVPPFEFVAWRIVWTLPICLLIVWVRRQGPQLRAAIADSKSLRWLLLSASLIAVNWVVYVWAIQNNNVYAASLGYYINPLVNVLLGTLLLGEKLNRAQWAAVGLAGLGVALLAEGALTTLWISLTLAFSFGVYGMVRKQVPVGSLPGLTIESGLLLIPSIAVAGWYAVQSGSSFAVSPQLSGAIVLGGVLTAIPLLMFAVAAKRMPYSTLGFIQFLAPSIVWAAAALFGWDMWRRSRAPKPVGPV